MSTETCCRLLIRRGFLLEQHGEDFVLSDNSHDDDSAYLNEILTTYNIGLLDGNRIIITNDNPNELQALFNPVPRGSVGVGSNLIYHSWNTVRNRYYARKIPVRWLESNIAYYIKALSACGIYTGGCCDGNHPGSSKLFIEFDGPVYMQLHACFWENLLDDMFPIKWNQSYTMVDLTTSRQEQYEKLYQAADFVYNYRHELGEIRMKSAQWIHKRVPKRMSDEDIQNRFLLNVCNNIDAFKKENYGLNRLIK